MATPNPSQHDSPDFYHVLGVNYNATTEEVSRAFRQRARQVHPDRQSNADVNDWHVLHKAYTTLMDNIQRKDYNEKLASEATDEAEPDYDKLALPTSVNISESFKKKYKEWMRECITNRNFRKSFDSKLRLKLNECIPLQSQNSNGKFVRVGKRKIETNVYVEDIMNIISREVKEFASLSVIKDATEHITRIIKLAKTSKPCSVALDDSVPIVDFSGSPVSDLMFMLSLFSKLDDQDHFSKDRTEIQKRLMVFIPVTQVQKKMLSVGQTNRKCSKCGSSLRLVHKCVSCEQVFCRRCPMASIKAPRIGIHVPRPICQKCISKLDFKDAEDWINKGIALLQEKSDNNEMPAMTCILIALIVTDDIVPVSHMRAVAKSYANQGQQEQALIFLSLINEVSAKHDVKLHISLMKILKEIAGQPGKAWREKWLLTLLAQQSLLLAEQSSISHESHFDIPNIENERKAIIKSIHVVESEKEKEYKALVNALLHELDTAWKIRELEEMVKIITKHEVTEVDALITHNGVEPAMKALEIFLNGKRGFVLQMLTEDQCALNFFQGFLNVCQCEFTKGFKLIEEAAWSGFHSKWLSETAIPIIILHISHHPSGLNEVKEVGEEILTTPQSEPIFFGNLIHVLGINEEDLNPSLKSVWPHLTIPGVNQYGTRKYEQIILQQVKESKLNYAEAGYNLINYIPSACHSSEIVVCFLNASLWFLKEMRTISPTNKQQIYALKKMVLYLVQNAYQLTCHALHPGMQFYVSRYGLAIVSEAISVNPKCVTADDSDIVVTLFKSVIDKGRYNPFWRMPIVPIYEAMLLNILTGRMHAEFMLHLQKKTNNGLLKNEEVQYQLYENDLRWTCQVENKDETRERAMEALLKEEGLSWSDVSNTMCSLLSPRTPDGWLLQQDHLEGDLPYCSVTGFEINIDQIFPSMKMSAIPRQRNKNGLFSVADVKTVVNIPAEKLFPIIFSLDPPDDSKRFHPFQKLRFEPACLENTDLLHTLLQTDYLMKCFSVGSDVSAQPPYNQRDCSEGITAKLPPRMQKILAPVSERGESFGSKTSRFWIQADEIEYNVTNVGNKVTCRIGAVKMVVRTSPQFPGLDGKLFDVEDDDPNSPEAKFAKDLTDNYDEISCYFPMFGRLRELCKLQVLGIILDGIQTSIKETAQGNGINISNDILREIQENSKRESDARISRMLQEIREKVGVWPKANDRDTFQSAYQTFREHIQSELSYRYLSYEVEEEMKKMVRGVLEEKDDKTVTQLTTEFRELLRGKRYRGNLEQSIRSWLSYGSPDLKNIILSTMPPPTKQDIKDSIMRNAEKELECLKGMVHKIAKNKDGVNGRKTCTWVPAAIKIEEREESMRMCYGGVFLAPKLNKCPSIPRMKEEIFCDLSRSFPSHVHNVHNVQKFSAPNGVTTRKGLTLCSLINPYESIEPLQLESTTLKIVKASIREEAMSLLPKLQQLMENMRKMGKSSGQGGHGRGGGGTEAGAKGGGARSGGAAGGGCGGGGGGNGGDDDEHKRKSSFAALLLLIPFLQTSLENERQKYEKGRRAIIKKASPALYKKMNAMVPNTDVLRSDYQQGKFRDDQQSKGKVVNQGMHAGHIVSLELIRCLLLHVDGCEITLQDRKHIKESCNKFRNFELVSAHTNQSVHRKIDRCLTTAIKDYLESGKISEITWDGLTETSVARERVRSIVKYFKEGKWHVAVTQRVEILRLIKNPRNPSQNLWDI